MGRTLWLSVISNSKVVPAVSAVYMGYTRPVCLSRLCTAQQDASSVAGTVTTAQSHDWPPPGSGFVFSLSAFAFPTLQTSVFSWFSITFASACIILSWHHTRTEFWKSHENRRQVLPVSCPETSYPDTGFLCFFFWGPPGKSRDSTINKVSTGSFRIISNSLFILLFVSVQSELLTT
jgi:hypothetical protein